MMMMMMMIQIERKYASRAAAAAVSFLEFSSFPIPDPFYPLRAFNLFPTTA